MLPAKEPTVIFQKLADGAVLFSPSTELYFGLNEVGSRVWSLLAPVSRTLDELCARLSAEYPTVPSEVLRVDVEELLAQLAAEGLVRPEG